MAKTRRFRSKRKSTHRHSKVGGKKHIKKHKRTRRTRRKNIKGGNKSIEYIIGKAQEGNRLYENEIKPFLVKKYTNHEFKLCGRKDGTTSDVIKLVNLIKFEEMKIKRGDNSGMVVKSNYETILKIMNDIISEENQKIEIKGDTCKIVEVVEDPIENTECINHDGSRGIIKQRHCVKLDAESMYDVPEFGSPENKWGYTDDYDPFSVINA